MIDWIHCVLFALENHPTALELGAASKELLVTWKKLPSSDEATAQRVDFLRRRLVKHYFPMAVRDELSKQRENWDDLACRTAMTAILACEATSDPCRDKLLDDALSRVVGPCALLAMMVRGALRDTPDLPMFAAYAIRFADRSKSVVDDFTNDVLTMAAMTGNKSGVLASA